MHDKVDNINKCESHYKGVKGDAKHNIYQIQNENQN